MSLINTYEKYVKINEEYIKLIDKLVDTDLSQCEDISVMEALLKAKVDFEELNIEAEKIRVEDKDSENLKDLKYLIMDGVFITSDLVAFYEHKHFERFKMRAVNYINKKRRAEIFKDVNCGDCRV
ncbi:hypothetical protein JCM1393_22850 [Clostridium carnis]